MITSARALSHRDRAVLRAIRAGRCQVSGRAAALLVIDELGASQIVWSPVAQGVLTGKYKPGQPAPSGSRAADEKGGADMISRFMNDDVLTRVQGLAPIADEAGLTMAQLAVAWVLQNDNVAAALVGASRPEQVHENVKAAGVKLEPELMARIDDVLGDIIERDPGKTKETAPQKRVA
jgi:aryl-alcohol dehydrogenase-like predicted oxidoreductase